MDMRKNNISDFYAQKSVFITGATGFIGKVLMEKLLYHCRDIDNIFILVREKKGISAEIRTNKLKNVPIFERLNKEAPQQFEKIICVNGDITEPKLGMSDEDRKTIIDKVSVVFHIAATLNFEENLIDAFALNVKSTSEIVKLCDQLYNLKALVYVSTAYTNIHQNKVIEEKVYQMPVDAAAVEHFLKKDTKTVFGKEILGEYANTYVYTKSIAENIIMEAGDRIPVAIVRPSIVGSSFHGPIEGWVDNYNAATTYVTGIQTGATRVMLLNADMVCDVVPVDLVANMLIVSAARTKDREPKVYNFTSGASNPTTWSEFAKYSIKSASKHCNYTYFPYAVIISNYYLNFFLAFFAQLLPAYLIHFILLLFGKRSRLVAIQKKLMKFADVIHPFTTHQWLWLDQNVRDLIDTLSTGDKQCFDIDVKNIKWPLYFENYTLGVKKYLLNTIEK